MVLFQTKARDGICSNSRQKWGPKWKIGLPMMGLLLQKGIIKQGKKIRFPCFEIVVGYYPPWPPICINKGLIVQTNRCGARTRLAKGIALELIVGLH